MREAPAITANTVTAQDGEIYWDRLPTKRKLQIEGPESNMKGQ